MPSDYARIEKALAYIADRVEDQPELDSVAASVGLSPFHFQRLFTRWVGVSPKKFLQYLTLERAKESLIASSSVLSGFAPCRRQSTRKCRTSFVIDPW